MGDAVPSEFWSRSAPRALHVLDVDADRRGTPVHLPLYQLEGSIADRTFEITFFEPAAKA
jgi:hypothetical protein